MFSNQQINFYQVSVNDENQRLDNLLFKLLKKVPKSHIFAIIRNGEVKVNSKKVKNNYRVSLNDIIRIPPIKLTTSKKPTIKSNRTFPILYEDDYFLIINKPSGIACHGGSGISFGIIEELRNTYKNNKFLELAHRLDKETSGILILAKKRLALTKLQEEIRNGNLHKKYLSIVSNNCNFSTKTIDLPLHKYLTKEGERRVKISDKEGKNAITTIKLLKNFNNFALLEITLHTGRTHQIRVHLQHINHPIIGDEKYGDFELNKNLHKLNFTRMYLHAYKIQFKHPINNIEINIDTGIPQEFSDFINKQPYIL